MYTFATNGGCRRHGRALPRPLVVVAACTLLALLTMPADAACYPSGRGDFATALESLGRGDLTTSTRLLLKLVEEQPECAEVRNNLAVVFVEQGRFEEATEQLREALRLRPGYQLAQRNVERLDALMFARAAQAPGGRERLAHAERLQPDAEVPPARREAGSRPSRSEPEAVLPEGATEEGELVRDRGGERFAVTAPAQRPGVVSERTEAGESARGQPPAPMQGRDPFSVPQPGDPFAYVAPPAEPDSGAVAAREPARETLPGAAAAAEAPAAPPRPAAVSVIEPVHNRICVHHRDTEGLSRERCYTITAAQVRMWPRWVVATETSESRIRLRDETGQLRLEIVRNDVTASGDAVRLRAEDFDALVTQIVPWRTAWVVLD